MSAFDLATFDVVLVKQFKRFQRNAIVESEVTFKAEKGHVFALLLLDQHKIGSEPRFNAEKTLNAAGWFFDADRANALTSGSADGDGGETPERTGVSRVPAGKEERT